jgi:hypothetical protein
MGRNKDLRKRIKGHERAIAEHHRKIAVELEKPLPDYGLIHHWEGEIRGHEKTVERLREKLPGGRK